MALKVGRGADWTDGCRGGSVGHWSRCGMWGSMGQGMGLAGGVGQIGMRRERGEGTRTEARGPGTRQSLEGQGEMRAGARPGVSREDPRQTYSPMASPLPRVPSTPRAAAGVCQGRGGREGRCGAGGGEQSQHPETRAAPARSHRRRSLHQVPRHRPAGRQRCEWGRLALRAQTLCPSSGGPGGTRVARGCPVTLSGAVSLRACLWGRGVSCHNPGTCSVAAV